ncbi:MAG: hypothetical protein ACI84K_002088 [Pseudohongiellaceae bacterium]|jgi:hypothetical protein
MQKGFCFLLLSLFNLFGINNAFAGENETQTQVFYKQANDLKYGAVLYELYQGHSFEALSALNVAKMRGGITGHKDHPALIEGSLMLSYGMTREAKALFELLLLNEADVDNDFVSENARNQAWFYLGKVLMLEQDIKGSWEALQHVNSNKLKHEQPDIFDEWLYLKALISQKIMPKDNAKTPLTLAQMLSAEKRYNAVGDSQKYYNWLYENGEITKEAAELLSNANGYIWQAYFRYNLAADSLNNKRYDLANKLFNALVSDLSKWLVHDVTNTSELFALRDQSLLSLGQLYLYQNNYNQALITLKRINIDSVFSDQALFTYAVAASHSQKFGLALQALNTLNDRELFSPWRQQAPYALAYLYEQLGEPELALEAYSAAVSHYENLAHKLQKDQAEVTENRVLQALNLQEKPIAQEVLSEQEIALALGRNRVASDEYGYLEVNPSDFNYAELLATEPFQLGLRDLHELYKLKLSLSRWEDQLNAFDLMMVTRKQLRKQRIDETLSIMAAQKSEQWIKRQQAFLLTFEQQADADNSGFFMDDDQRGYYAIIQRMTNNLAQLPNGEEKDRFAQKLKRMKAYFSWWIDDQYSVNSWAAKKQLNGLTRAVDEFKQRNAVLKKHVSSDEVNQKLFSRIKEGRVRLSILKHELEQNLTQASTNLLILVKEELGRQREETQRYLLAASKAQARIADMLFLNNPDGTEAQSHSEINLKEGDK